ncbi:hypothetical protein ABG067_005126 [Albugo candida]|uniref:HMG box domain-containing protein n=2 Tax=Albugo candida TaxID=65357 RepID=A0A024GH39_9STRA|nr:unnamed protein product [Albugo candida]|eukprot:CCI45662.1 unnamed protein product [Albugo candida]
MARTKTADTGDTRRRIRRKKDKNAPKRALSAFMFFSNDIRDQVKKEMPELEFLQISTEIGKRWKQCKPEDRKPYEELAEADKKRYQEEKEDYVPDPSFETTRSIRKKKDPDAPKRALSAYFFFCNEARDALRRENPDMKITDISRLLAEKWRDLPEKKRAKYHKMHEGAKVKYQEQMDVYNAQKDGVVVEEEHDEEVEDDDDEE